MARMLMMRGMTPKSTLSGNLAWDVQHAACQLTEKKLFTMLDNDTELWYIIVMKPRNIIDEHGNSFTVHQHIILKNFWEYYLGETDKDGVAFGYVMGNENEWGSVYMPEIQPYIIGKARANDLYHIMPPEGYYWEDEQLVNN